MSSHAGRYTLGPDNATLTVRTGTAGAMAKAGHNLELRVTAWSAQLELGDDPAAGSLSLEVDTTSLRVIGGHGGPKPLADEDKSRIEQTITAKILKRGRVSFRSTRIAAAAGGGLDVEGELDLLGTIGPARFTLAIGADGQLNAATEITQTAFGIEPYSAMLGALKVKDALQIDVEGTLPAR